MPDPHLLEADVNEQLPGPDLARPEETADAFLVPPSPLQQVIDGLRLVLRDAERSRDQYVDLYEQAPVGYLTLDLDSVILDVNMTGVRLLARERSQIAGLRFAQFVAFEDRSRYEQTMLRIAGNGISERFDVSLIRGDGAAFCAQLDCIHVIARDMQSPVRITMIDVSARKMAEAEIRQLAFYDPLTALPNRRLLLDRLQHAFLECTRSQQHGALFFIDVNDFKSLNDTQGHNMGDLLLRQVAGRLGTCVRESDTVSRLGGDEFIVLIQNLMGDHAEATTRATIVGNKIIAAFSVPHLLDEFEYHCTVSMGITLFRDSVTSVEDLLKRADMALYRAKTQGRSSMQFFDLEMQATATARDELDVDLRRGLSEDQFVLHYQPKVSYEKKVTGAEALLRWEHPSRGCLLPAQFIPFAEEKGLIGLMGQWVLRAACRQLALWSEVPSLRHLTIAINVSAAEFSHPDFVSRMLSVIDSAGVDPHRLILEFTERVMLGTMDDTLAKMKVLKGRGIYFSLDDFGIGYSSLAYLQSLPLDELKIDRTFVRNILTNPNDAAIARSIIALAQSLGLAVIAEGVESEEQCAFLAAQGCRAFQGYLFGKPMRPSELVTRFFH